MFLQFIDEELAPKLRPGDVVILDNPRAHYAAGVRERIEATGARLLYQPPYSPDLNPIELAWSKIKSALRALGQRSIALLTLAIYFVARNISPKDAAGWFKHSGVLRAHPT